MLCQKLIEKWAIKRINLLGPKQLWACPGSNTFCTRPFNVTVFVLVYSFIYLFWFMYLFVSFFLLARFFVVVFVYLSLFCFVAGFIIIIIIIIIVVVVCCCCCCCCWEQFEASKTLQAYLETNCFWYGISLKPTVKSLSMECICQERLFNPFIWGV